MLLSLWRWWRLALCIGTVYVTLLVGVLATKSLSQPITEPRHRRDSSGANQGGYFWTFWTPKNKEVDSENVSYFTHLLNWSGWSWDSNTKDDNAERSREAPAAVSSPTSADMGREGRGPASSEMTVAPWETSITTLGPETLETPEGTGLSPFSLPSVMPQKGTGEQGTELPWLTGSFVSERSLSQTSSKGAVEAVRSKSSQAPSTEGGESGQNAENLRTFLTPPGLDTVVAKPTLTAEDDSDGAPGTGAEPSRREQHSGMSTLVDQSYGEPTTESKGGGFRHGHRPPAEHPWNTDSPADGLHWETEEDEEGAEHEEGEQSFQWTATISSATTLSPLFTGTLPDEDWILETTVNDSYSLPDCSLDATGACNASDAWNPAFPDDNGTFNQSYNPLLLLTPPMFVPLYSDWNTAMATWGVAWEVHVYGLGSLFALVAFLSLLNMLCLPVRCPSGCGYFALVNLFLLVTGTSRAFSLFYDAYSHQDKLPAAGTLLLYEAPFPCLTASFAIVFLLLSMRSRMQLSHSVLQHPCFLAAVVLLHFGATFGSVALLQVFTRLPCLFFISQGAFVVLAAALAAAYFVFYCYVRADSKHIYHLNNTSPPLERYNRCPFADAKDWERAAATAVFAALFVLACAGLQLYAMLHALGLGGADVFPPWPWWAFQLSCRLCEAGVCLTLGLIVTHPLFCSSDLPQPGCWPRLLCGHLAVKSAVVPNSYSWSQQEKLVVCDTIARGESECLPLYTLVDHGLGSVDGLDLLYHSNRALACREMDLLKAKGDSPKSSFQSLHLDSDSTADLRPPSPINLRRSIDEALFSEALFPQSLFSSCSYRSPSNLSLSARRPSDTRPFQESSAERGLYRTSSCVNMEAPPGQTAGLRGHALCGPCGLDSASFSSSTEPWKGSSSSSLYRASLDGSSLVLCSSPERPMGRVAPPHLSQGSLNQVAQLQRRYRSLGSASRESLEEPASRDLAVQAEFISVCRQIDALSVCSDTIDL